MHNQLGLWGNLSQGKKRNHLKMQDIAPFLEKAFFWTFSVRNSWLLMAFIQINHIAPLTQFNSGRNSWVLTSASGPMLPHTGTTKSSLVLHRKRQRLREANDLLKVTQLHKGPARGCLWCTQGCAILIPSHSQFTIRTHKNIWVRIGPFLDKQLQWFN